MIPHSSLLWWTLGRSPSFTPPHSLRSEGLLTQEETKLEKFLCNYILSTNSGTFAFVIAKHREIPTFYKDPLFY